MLRAVRKYFIRVNLEKKNRKIEKNHSKNHFDGLGELSNVYIR